MAQDLPDPPAGAQPLLGFMSNEQWDALIGEVDALVGLMEALPHGEVRTNVFRLLDGIDAIHRESLRRLVRLFKEGVLEKVVSDPAIHTLLELYDLLPPEPAQLQPGPTPRFPTIPIRVIPAGPAAPARYPHWVPVLARADELPSGTVRDEISADGLALLLARRNERLFALDAQCPVDGAPLLGAGLNGYTLSCPNHAGCHYDVRTGHRIGGGQALGCHPVRVDDQGRVLVGLDMDFVPDVPSF